MLSVTSPQTNRSSSRIAAWNPRLYVLGGKSGSPASTLIDLLI
jgi:hypothetical protein